MTTISVTNKSWWYWIAGAALFLALAILVIYGVSFLAEQFNTAFNSSLIKPGEPVKFNLDKIPQLTGQN